MIKGKYIYLGCNLYKFVNPHKFDLSEAVSLINVMTGEFARHRDGIIIDSSYEADELFLYDSSFKFQVIDNSVTLFCTNPGMQMHYIADCNGVLRIVQGEQFSNYLSLFPILDKEATFVKDSLPIQNENERKVVAFGSSSTEIFDYIDGDETVFEQEPLRRLAENSELKAYKHNGFWKCMDTQREKEQLEEMIIKGEAPWMVWNK